MSVIKPEYISKEITRHDLLPMTFLKKSAYTGSKGNLRFRIAGAERGEDEEKTKVLEVITWFTPFAFDQTPEEEKTGRDFPFSDEGLEEIVRYLNKLRTDEGQREKENGCTV